MHPVQLGLVCTTRAVKNSSENVHQTWFSSSLARKRGKLTTLSLSLFTFSSYTTNMHSVFAERLTHYQLLVVPLATRVKLYRSCINSSAFFLHFLHFILLCFSTRFAQIEIRCKVSHSRVLIPHGKF